MMLPPVVFHSALTCWCCITVSLRKSPISMVTRDKRKVVQNWHAITHARHCPPGRGVDDGLLQEKRATNNNQERDQEQHRAQMMYKRNVKLQQRRGPEPPTNSMSPPAELSLAKCQGGDRHSSGFFSLQILPPFRGKISAIFQVYFNNQHIPNFRGKYPPGPIPIHAFVTTASSTIGGDFHRVRLMCWAFCSPTHPPFCSELQLFPRNRHLPCPS